MNQLSSSHENTAKIVLYIRPPQLYAVGQLETVRDWFLYTKKNKQLAKRPNAISTHFKTRQDFSLYLTTFPILSHHEMYFTASANPTTGSIVCDTPIPAIDFCGALPQNAAPLYYVYLCVHAQTRHRLTNRFCFASARNALSAPNHNKNHARKIKKR